MKTFQMAVLFVFAFFSLSAASADDLNENLAQIHVRLSKTGEKKAVIRITNLQAGGRTLLKIRNKQGRIIHAERIHGKTEFACVYNFSKMNDKSYTVEVKNSHGSVQESFEMIYKKALFFKPVIRTEEKMIHLVFKNIFETPLFVKLYDLQGREVYACRVAPDEVFANKLDVSNINQDQFSLSIFGQNYTFAKSIRTK